MFKFSIAPSEYLASSFESKLNMCDRTGCAYVEISDIVEKQFLGDMDDKKIRSMRELLIEYGKTISLVTCTGKVSDKERFQKLLHTAQQLRVKAIKVGSAEYETPEAFWTDIESRAAEAACCGIDLCVENTRDQIFAQQDPETHIKNANGSLKIIFDPLAYARTHSDPIAAPDGCTIKNSVAFLRIRDGLSDGSTPVMPGRGCAELKALTEHLLRSGFDGYFSFTDYFGGMCWADLMEYVAAFRTLLKEL